MERRIEFIVTYEGGEHAGEYKTLNDNEQPPLIGSTIKTFVEGRSRDAVVTKTDDPILFNGRQVTRIICRVID